MLMMYPINGFAGVGIGRGVVILTDAVKRSSRLKATEGLVFTDEENADNNFPYAVAYGRGGVFQH